MRKIDIDNWSRKEHFDFFSKFDEPFFGIVSELDVTKSLKLAKENQQSFFAWYLFRSMHVVHQIPEFKTRMVDGEIIEYETIHASPTIGRKDNSFAFSFVRFQENFKEFAEGLQKEIDAVLGSSGLRLNSGTQRIDTVHYSSLPWIKFKGLSHARDYKVQDSCPKITFGKIYKADGKWLMPISIDAHHGLMDGWHVGKYLELFQEKLDQED